MKKAFVIAASVTGLFSGDADAQNIVKETPHLEEFTASVGSVVWEKIGSNGTPGVIISAPITASFKFNQTVTLASGTSLMIIRDKKLKACREKTTTELGGYSFGGWVDCVVDTDGDGKFDRVSVNELAGAKNIAPPVEYLHALVPIVGTGGVSFKKSLTYLGVSAGSIRLSYREFANDIARPAFTEDLTFPTPEKFPQNIMVKSIKLTVLKIGPDGLTYHVE